MFPEISGYRATHVWPESKPVPIHVYQKTRGNGAKLTRIRESQVVRVDRKVGKNLWFKVPEVLLEEGSLDIRMVPKVRNPDRVYKLAELVHEGKGYFGTKLTSNTYGLSRVRFEGRIRAGNLDLACKVTSFYSQDDHRLGVTLKPELSVKHPLDK